jgi:cell division protein FtsN
MPHNEHGPYEPSDEVRIFDALEEDEDPEGSRLPLLIVLALLVLVMFGGVVWLAYSYGVVHGRSEPRVLAAQPGPARVAPANPGGTKTPYKGFKIYEQPAPSDEEADTVPPQPAATQQVALQKPAGAAPQKPSSLAIAAPKAAAPKMAMPKVAAPQVAAMAAPQAAKPVAPPPAHASAPPARLGAPAAQPEAPKTAAAAAAQGAYILQIGAYKSEADAGQAWKTYKARHAALLAGYGPNIQRADLGAKGVWYRLRIAGFASKDAAIAVCGRLKADGGSCFLGR